MFDEFLQNGLTLNALRSFLLVAEKGGYSKAADGDPSISANLKNRVAGLRGPFHEVPLFQPQGRGVVLTAKGRELQRVATQALQLLDDFRRSCQEEREIVRIGGGQSLFDGIFLPRWERIHQQLGKVRFQFHNLRTADAVSQIQEQRLDFALIRPDAPGLDGLGSHPLGKIDFAFCVPKQFMRTIPDVPRLSDVNKKLPLATIAGDGQFRKQLESFAKAQGFCFRYVVECTSQSQVQSFLATGTVAAVLRGRLSASLPEVIQIPLVAADGFVRDAALVWLPARLEVVTELQEVKSRLAKLLLSR
jgi:DNA-binding transcriptional LysR family regulator